MATFREYVAQLPVAYTDKKGKDWYDLDPATLPAKCATQYEVYRKAQEQANTERKLFDSMTRDTLADPAIQFGHKYEKLSFTLLDKASKTGNAKGKINLTAWLDQQRANGRAA